MVDNYNAAVASVTGTAGLVDQVIEAQRSDPNLSDEDRADLDQWKRLPFVSAADAHALLGPVAKKLECAGAGQGFGERARHDRSVRGMDRAIDVAVAVAVACRPRRRPRRPTGTAEHRRRVRLTELRRWRMVATRREREVLARRALLSLGGRQPQRAGKGVNPLRSYPHDQADRQYAGLGRCVLAEVLVWDSRVGSDLCGSWDSSAVPRISTEWYGLLDIEDGEADARGRG